MAGTMAAERERMERPIDEQSPCMKTRTFLAFVAFLVLSVITAWMI